MKIMTERQRAVKKANERIAHLREQGANFKAKLGIYGLEITHFRPSSRKDHVAISTEIIPIPTYDPDEGHTEFGEYVRKHSLNH